MRKCLPWLRSRCDQAIPESASWEHRLPEVTRHSYVADAYEKGGAKAARDIDELVGEVTGLFAGGSLSEEALEGAMKALNDAYWIAKAKNKKYAPKKYRKSEDPAE